MKNTLFLTTLLLTLGINGQSAEPLDQLEKERQAIAALKKQIKKVETSPSNRDAAKRKQGIVALQQDLAFAKNHISELEKELEGMRSQLDSNPLLLLTEGEKRKYVERLMNDIQQLEKQIKNDVRVIPEKTKTKLKPVLVSISANELSIGEFNQEQTTVAFKRDEFVPELIRGYRRYNPKTHYFVFFFKPSACHMTVPVHERGGALGELELFEAALGYADNLGFKFGYEPIHEEAVLIFSNTKGKEEGESLRQLTLQEAQSERKELERLLKQLQADGPLAAEQAKRDELKFLEVREELEKLEEESLNLSQNVARFETLLEHDKLAKQLDQVPYRKISLPIESETKAEKINVIVLGGKIYPTAKIERDGRQVIDRTHIKWGMDEQKRQIAQPNPIMGLHPELNKDAINAFLQTLQDGPRDFGKEFFIEMAVFADSQSFAVFNKLRDAASLRKIGYNWQPITSLPVPYGISSEAGTILNSGGK